MKKDSFLIIVLKYAAIAAAAIIGAFNYNIFVFPNNFAPAGLNGIATMVQYLYHFNIGYMSLIINIPLCILALFTLNARYAYRTLTYVVVFSFANIYLKNIDFSYIAFRSVDAGEAIMAAIAAGVINGLIYSVTLHFDGCTGGTDIIAAFVGKVRPDFNLVWVIFGLNVTVSILSFFVYGMQYRAVILCIIYSFVTGRVNNSILKGFKTATKFEIVTPYPDEIASDIIKELKHGCTIVSSKGAYSGQENSILLCIVNNNQIVDFKRLIKRYDRTFVIVSDVSETLGNFKHIKARRK